MFDDLRQRLEASLGKLPGPVWDRLDENGYLDGKTPYPEILAEARRELRYVRESLEDLEGLRDVPVTEVTPVRSAFTAPRAQRHERDEPSDTPERYVSERAAAMSEFFALQAQTNPLANPRVLRPFVEYHLSRLPEAEARARLAPVNPYLQRFREALGAPLTAGQALRALASPAIRYLTLEDFTSCGIPLGDHVATLAEDGWSSFDEREAPPGVCDPWSKALRIQWAGGEINEVFRYPMPPEGAPRPTFPEMACLETDEGQVHGWPKSVVSILAHWSKALSGRLSPWRIGQVAMYILTDERPWVSPVDVSANYTWAPAFNHARLNLSVLPWVPAEVVADIYRQKQREMIGGPNRWIRERARALFRFVIAEERRAGVRPSWKGLHAKWNAEHPEWKYPTEQRMVSEFHRVSKQFLKPQYERIPVDHPDSVADPAHDRHEGGERDTQ